MLADIALILLVLSSETGFEVWRLRGGRRDFISAFLSDIRSSVFCRLVTHLITWAFLSYCLYSFRLLWLKL